MNNILSSIKTISLKYKEIDKVVLFGSRARKDANEKSDYDIALFMKNSNDLIETTIFNEINEIETFHKIDLVFIKNKCNNDKLLLNIEKDGVIIVDKFAIKLENLKKAFQRLQESIEEFDSTKSLSVRDGTIQRFEFTTELSWKSLREHLLTLGVVDINNPKAVLIEAYNNDLVEDEAGWLQILKDRNMTSHIYDEDEAQEIFNRIAIAHIKLFNSLINKLSNI
jgi:nucleotidyltransferase substrate binding protein (TIGR01987 family)